MTEHINTYDAQTRNCFNEI